MTLDPIRSPFAGLAIEPKARPVVELLIVGLILEVDGRGEELGIDPLTLLTSDIDGRQKTAISNLVNQLACELGIAAAEVEVRISQYFLEGPANPTADASDPWRPPRLWPFFDPRA